jgi:hypothetical protein
VDLLTSLWRLMPWHTNLSLVLHDLLRPLEHRPGLVDEPGACVCLYSWNQADLLRQTLRSLHESELGAARVVVLDNGSDDETPAVVAEASRRWPAERFSSVRLDVNVGAPAARNWLLSLPEVRASRWIAFVDDDVFLPRNWLAGLLDAAHAHPEAAAVGCSIAGHVAPHQLQAADFNAVPKSLGSGTFSDIEEELFLHNNCIGLRDTGLFRYSRPCMSVTGCCHLLNGALLEEVGDFDVRFNPSQFDDLERDLRAFSQGRPQFYNGHVRVLHVQQSSLRQAADAARQAHIFGNKLKLEHLFTPEQSREMRRRCRAMVWEDLAPKLEVLHDHARSNTAS